MTAHCSPSLHSAAACRAGAVAPTPSPQLQPASLQLAPGGGHRGHTPHPMADRPADAMPHACPLTHRHPRRDDGGPADRREFRPSAATHPRGRARGAGPEGRRRVVSVAHALASPAAPDAQGAPPFDATRRDAT